MHHRLLSILVALIAALTLAIGAAAAGPEDENPLEPFDTSSPRATYESFLEHTGEVEEALLAYRSNRSFERQSAYIEVLQ